MIVKILSSSGTFAGVNYNEGKVAQGTAQLMAAENFGMLQRGRTGIGNTDYKGYFQSWSKSGDGVQLVKQPQFHAVISCEGREKGAYELQGIAQQYLGKMGYAGNPYLVYFHTDTANNHVHIVSTRVDGEGRKIDDSFERTRSQKIMKEILLQDVGEEMRSYVNKALSYNFSTDAQFRMLMEGQGVKVEDVGTSYCFIRYGRIISALDKEKVAEKAARYAAPEGRIKQLKAVFASYKPGLSPKAFQAFMQSRFGVELVFHKAKGQQAPYGYSILDHAKKQVLKGAQVMQLSELMAAVGRQDRIFSAQGVTGAVAKDTSLTYADFKGQLKALGFSVNKQGEVKLKGEPQAALKVDAEVMKQLHHNERLQQARGFAITNPVDARILSKVFYLKPQRLEVNSAVNEDAREHAAGRLNSMLANGKQLQEILESNGWGIAKLNKEHYLIDKREKAVHPMSALTERHLDYGAVSVASLDGEHTRAATAQAAYASGGIGDMLAMLAQMAQEGAVRPQRERKHTRRRKR